MVVADVVRGITICVIPALSAVGHLSLLSIYAVVFTQGCMEVVFLSGQFAAVVALVEKDHLVPANSLVSASYSGASLVGASLAGLMFSVLPIADALYVDSFSFLVSALSLALVRRSFNAVAPTGLRLGSLRALTRTLSADTKSGLAYVLHSAVLRNISLQVMLVNLLGSAATAELALFATQRLHANNSQVGYLFASSSLGVVALSFLSGPLNRRLSLSSVVVLALLLYGGGIAAFGLLSTYAVALGVWGIVGGGTVIFNVSCTALRQRVVPDELMGRVWGVALTGAWCAIPIGALGGGVVISVTHDPRILYATVGIAIVLVALVFKRIGLKDADLLET